MYCWSLVVLSGLQVSLSFMTVVAGRADTVLEAGCMEGGDCGNRAGPEINCVEAGGAGAGWAGPNGRKGWWWQRILYQVLAPSASVRASETLCPRLVSQGDRIVSFSGGLSEVENYLDIFPPFWRDWFVWFYIYSERLTKVQKGQNCCNSPLKGLPQNPTISNPLPNPHLGSDKTFAQGTNSHLGYTLYF